MSEETITNVIEGIKEVKHIFQNSYEVGKAGNRHTIKYFTIEELKQQLEFLKNMGLLDEEPNLI